MSDKSTKSTPKTKSFAAYRIESDGAPHKHPGAGENDIYYIVPVAAPGVSDETYSKYFGTQSNGDPLSVRTLTRNDLKDLKSQVVGIFPDSDTETPVPEKKDSEEPEGSTTTPDSAADEPTPTEFPLPPSNMYTVLVESPKLVDASKGRLSERTVFRINHSIPVSEIKAIFGADACTSLRAISLSTQKIRDIVQHVHADKFPVWEQPPPAPKSARRSVQKSDATDADATATDADDSTEKKKPSATPKAKTSTEKKSRVRSRATKAKRALFSTDDDDDEEDGEGSNADGSEGQMDTSE